MRISDWSSDVCSSDLGTERTALAVGRHLVHAEARRFLLSVRADPGSGPGEAPFFLQRRQKTEQPFDKLRACPAQAGGERLFLFSVPPREPKSSTPSARNLRSEEHTSELQSLMRISYAVFCFNKKKQTNKHQQL